MKFISVRLGTLILSAVIAGILVAVCSIGWLVYASLDRTIQEEFSRKLSAISSVTAAFIDATDHEKILAGAPRMRALARDPGAAKLYGVSSTREGSSLVEIDSSTGAADWDGPALDRRVISLAFFPAKFEKAGQALALLANTAQLATMDIATGKFSDFVDLPENTDGRGIAISPMSGAVFLGAGDGLYRVDLASGGTTPVELTRPGGMNGPGEEPADYVIDELTFLSDGTLLFCQHEGEDNKLQLWAIDLVDPAAATVQRINLVTRDSRTQETTEFDSALPLLALTDSGEPGGLLATTDRLVRIALQRIDGEVREGVCSDAEMQPLFGYEQLPDYLKYTEPLRAIKKRDAELAYLYTQTLSDTDDIDQPSKGTVDRSQVRQIIYVLDANIDSDHTTVGTPDSDPANEMMRDVYFKGADYISEIEATNDWGLIKSGFAPIIDPQGRIVAMAGADVKAGDIRQRTKTALAKVVLTSVFALLLGSLVSILVSRKLIAPIERLKDVALRIAAGEHGQQIEGAGVRELAELSETFNAMSTTLEEKVVNLEKTNKEREIKRRQFELVHRLTLRDADLAAYGAWVELLSSGASHLSPSGWTNSGRFVAGWIAPDQGSIDANLRFRAETSAVFIHFLRLSEGDRKTMRNFLDDLFHDRLQLAFLIDLELLTLRSVTWGTPALWKQGAGAAEAAMTPVVGEPVSLEAGTQYFICGEMPLAQRMSDWETSITESIVPAFKQKMVDIAEQGDGSFSAIAVNLKAPPLEQKP